MSEFVEVTATCASCYLESTIRIDLHHDSSYGTDWLFVDHIVLFEKAGWTIKENKKLPNMARYCPTCSTKDA